MDGTIFAFGSLMNKHTIETGVLGIKPSRVLGLQRGWIEPFVHNHVAYRALGIQESEPDDVVHGATLFVTDRTLKCLYAREASYRRIIVDAIDKYDNIDYATTFATREIAPDYANIPMSYIATVAEGFLKQYGQRGLELFITNTSGWEAGIVDDTDEPVYPRTLRTTDDIIAIIRPSLAKITDILHR